MSVKALKAAMLLAEHGALAAMTEKGTSQIRLRTADQILPEIKQAMVMGTALESNLGVAIKPVATQKAGVGSPQATTPKRQTATL